LGLNTNDYGAVFEWRQGADTTKKGFSQWSPFNEKTKYFAPSTKEFMVNYRVENLDALLIQLKKDSVTITDKVETAEYGKFVHIMDLEGNKIELWEPNDVEFEKLGLQIGAKTTK
jgi:predicted enzyme related to lactoylglutathione lyase